MSSELITINIVIGDRTYRIKVSAQDEQSVRKTVKTVNDKIVEYKTQFAGKDMQDYIAMVMIWYATLQAEQKGQPLIEMELKDKLADLEKMMDGFSGE